MSNLMEKSTALYQELPLFQEKIQQLAAVMKVNLADYQIDHLALRANTEEKAKNWLTELLKCGRILSDNIVNGRPPSNTAILAIVFPISIMRFTVLHKFSGAKI